MATPLPALDLVARRFAPGDRRSRLLLALECAALLAGAHRLARLAHGARIRRLITLAFQVSR